MKLKKNYEQFLHWSLILGYCVFLLIFHAIQARKTYLNGDETFIVLAWAQTGIKNIFTATRLNTLSPPFDFFVGHEFWRLQEYIFGKTVHYELELFVRTYSLLLMFAGTVLLLRTLSKIFANGFLFVGFSLIFVVLSPGIHFFFIEARLYAVLYFFTCLSWYLWFGYLGAPESNKQNWLKAWLLISGLGYWFHIFQIPNSALQALGLCLLDFRPTLRRLHEMKRKYLLLAFEGLSFLGFLLIFKYRMAGAANANFAMFMENLLHRFAMIFQNFSLNTERFFPLLGPKVIILPMIGIGVTAYLRRGIPLCRDTVVLLASLFAFVLTLILPFLAYPHQNFDFRHILFSIPLIVISCAVSIELIWLALARSRIYVGLVFVFGMAFLILKGHPVAKQFIFNFPTVVSARKKILTQHLRPIGYIGINENDDLSLTTNEQGVTLSFVHILTLKNMHELPRPEEVYFKHIQKYGFLSRKCLEREKFPLIDEVVENSVVLVDFCELENVVVRDGSSLWTKN